MGFSLSSDSTTAKSSDVLTSDTILINNWVKASGIPL